MLTLKPPRRARSPSSPACCARSIHQTTRCARAPPPRELGYDADHRSRPPRHQEGRGRPRHRDLVRHLRHLNNTERLPVLSTTVTTVGRAPRSSGQERSVPSHRAAMRRAGRPSGIDRAAKRGGRCRRSSRGASPRTRVDSVEKHVLIRNSPNSPTVSSPLLITKCSVGEKNWTCSCARAYSTTLDRRGVASDAAIGNAGHC